jgi:formylglycine-generating enzyme required for sulfatase activity/Tol biopolymer transport system component
MVFLLVKFPLSIFNSASRFPAVHRHNIVPWWSVILLVLVLPVDCLCAEKIRDRAGAKQVPPPHATSLPAARGPESSSSNFESLRLAIFDLIETFGDKYPRGPEYLARLNGLEAAAQAADKACPELAEGSAQKKLHQLTQEAMLANPLLDFAQLLLVKRRYSHAGRGAGEEGTRLGFPTNHECNSSLNPTGYDNEIAILSPIRPNGKLTTLYRPTDGGYAGEVDLHWDADRLLFTKSNVENWQIWEIGTDGSGLRQVSRAPADVDCFDACYIPDGRIIFGSTASYQAVPCWHGQKLVSNLYIMNQDGSGVRQLCFDQDHNFHPVMLPDGQVLYHRWDYTGINHIFMRQLMVMNPDGTGQRAIYGSNSWFPNSLYFPRPIPGASNMLVSILSGYHGVHRMGRLVLLDISRGWHDANGIVREIPRRGQHIKIEIRDNLVDNDWPKFLHPYPLSDKYFLVSCWMDRKSQWGIYLADVFDNLVLIREEPGYALLEPIPLKKTFRPSVIPDRVDPTRNDATVYLHDVYAGPGLAGVPRGTVKSLRVLAYHFGYPALAGPDKVGYGGPWEVMRILGTVPLEKDGSAIFKVPANTPIAVQPLDVEGKAVQFMRSWFTAMPGEVLSCVGCHEPPGDAPTTQIALAARREPSDITPWHGPARGFDFAREVQPVLDRYCVSCHNGQIGSQPDLRPQGQVKDYKGRRISDLGVQRLHPQMLKDTSGILRYTPAYEALLPYIRRVGIEDDVSMLVPGEYHADTSELIQMLRKGHKGVQLNAEAWDRLITWLDLNAPCHGTWGQVYPIPDGVNQRRMELRKLYGGPQEDPETLLDLARQPVKPVEPQQLPEPKEEQVPGWPFGADVARQRQQALRPHARMLDLGNGIKMKLVLIPPGEFVMGDPNGEPDEYLLARITIHEPFWMGVCEVTNEQFRRFDPSHDCRYYGKRHARPDDQGFPLNGPDQPAVRVSWEQAVAFCRWLSEKTGMEFMLPTEAQWEYACRAGTATALNYGEPDADLSSREAGSLSRWANVADKSFSVGQQKDGKQITGGLEHLVLEGAALSDVRFNDGAIVTAPVGSYQPNAWGLYDMHGNAAEWTRTTYAPYPYHDDNGRNELGADGRKVVRGGSFFDRPDRCRSAFRLAYPPWQRVFNVGFRVVCEMETWQQTMLSARQRLKAVQVTREQRDDAQRQIWREIERDFPVQCDWASQDYGPNFYKWFGSDRDTDMERWIINRMLIELGSEGKELAAELQMLCQSNPPPHDQRWLDLYVKACEKRREIRLRPLLKRGNQIVFTKHYNMGGSHYAYTEGQSDAQHERHFVPGSALCVLQMHGIYGEGPRPAGAQVRTLIDDPDGVIRDPDVSFDGRRILFAWKKSDRQDDYHLYEMNAETGNLRQLTFGLGFADYEGAYLPNSDIIFNSTRCVQTVDCWWTEVSNLYTCDKDGKYLRRLTFDQVHTNFPTVMEDGRVIYTRWEYNDRGQIYSQGLFQMNPDGTGQTELYANNSWFPTTIMHARGIPAAQKVVAILCGHHTHQHGKLAIIDNRMGRQEASGVQLIAPVRRTEAVRVDAYGQDGDQFQYPYPLSETEFLVAYDPQGSANGQYVRPYAIYLMTIDGRRELLASDPNISCNQPIPLAPRDRPHIRPSLVDYRQKTGTYYMQDVYAGQGLEGIPRGTVKKLRVIALDYRAAGIGRTYNSGPGGESLSSTPVSVGNASWDVKLVLGDATVYEDGSALFIVPARTPVYFQALDAKGHMVQTMRSWSALQPNETFSCVGCHESKNEAPPIRRTTLAMQAGPEPLKPFYGPPRGFSFHKEIQPILDRHCVSCHTGKETEPFSLSASQTVDGNLKRKWSDSYLALTGAQWLEWPGSGFYYKGNQDGELVNWINNMSVPTMLPPYDKGAAKSGLITILEQGHEGVNLSPEEMDKIACWIDLLVPYCGDYIEANAWSQEGLDKYMHFLNKRQRMEQIERKNIEELIAANGRLENVEAPIAK